MGKVAQALGDDLVGYGNWVNPDDVWAHGDFVTILYGKVMPQYPTTFLYKVCNQNNKHSSCEHFRIAMAYLEEQGADEDDIEEMRIEGRDILEDTALLGRQGEAYERTGVGSQKGEIKKYLAFWNYDTEMYDRMLIPCLEEMKKAGIYDPSAILSTPFGYQELREIEGTGRAKTRELSDEEKKHIDMLRRMHLARGEEKKAIRKALGLWSDKPAEPGLFGKMYQQRFDPEVAKWWTPECNLNFREYVEAFLDPWEVRKQQVVDVEKAINKLVYGKGLDIEEVAMMPVRELMDLLDIDSPRFAAMVKSLASGAAEREKDEPPEYEPPWKSIA